MFLFIYMLSKLERGGWKSRRPTSQMEEIVNLQDKLLVMYESRPRESDKAREHLRTRAKVLSRRLSSNCNG